MISAGRWWWATSLGLVALFVALHFWDPAVARGPDLCLFHRATGLACPACGLTRAAAALAKGHFAESWRWHPLAGLLAGEALVGWLVWGAALAGRARSANPARPAGPAEVAARPAPMIPVAPIAPIAPLVPLVPLVPIIALATGLLMVVVWLVRWRIGALPP